MIGKKKCVKKTILSQKVDILRESQVFNAYLIIPVFFPGLWFDIPYFITDNSKVSNLYRWKPEKSIDDIIKDTYLWMKLNINKLKIYIK